MLRTNRFIVALLCTSCWTVLGSEISGRITLEKRFTRKTVAPAIYDLRGVTLPGDRSTAESSGQYERVAIWLESSEASPAAPISASMQQRNRRFEPELLVVPVGSTVEFPNGDPIFHNIFSLSRTQSFDLGYYSEGRSRRVTFPRPGIVQVYCHVHPNMYGAIAVTSSRWSGKPGPDGTFRWSNVVPGKYTFTLWQKSLGVLHRSVVVPESGSVHLNVAIPEADPEN
jgi:plastocyanin